MSQMVGSMGDPYIASTGASVGLDVTSLKPARVERHSGTQQVVIPRSKEEEHYGNLNRLIMKNMKMYRSLIGGSLTSMMFNPDLVSGAPRTPLPEHLKYSWQDQEGKWINEYQEELTPLEINEMREYLSGKRVEPYRSPIAEGPVTNPFALVAKGAELFGPTLSKPEIWIPAIFGKGRGMDQMSPEDKERAQDEMMTNVMKDLAFLAAVEVGPVANLAWKGAMKGTMLALKTGYKAGMLTPRLTVRLIDDAIRTIPGQKGLAYGMEGLWENWAVKPAHWKIFPGYSEGPKSLAEVFQPAIERWTPKMQVYYRNMNARRSLVDEAAVESGFDLAKMKPGETNKFFSDMRKGKLPKELEQKIKAIQLPKTHDAFLRRNIKKKFGGLSKDLEKSLSKHEDLDDFIDSPSTKKFLKGIDDQLTGDFKPKVTEMYLKRAMVDETVDPKLRLYARDILNLKYDSPQVIAEASKDAARQYLAATIKRSGMAKIVKPVGEESYDWMNWTGTQFSGLKDLYLPRDIYLELKAIEQIPKIGVRSFNRWFLTPWKTSKVIMRPATHVRNVISNMILNDWGGLPFYRMDVYYDAMREMKRGGKFWKEWKKLTGGGGTFTLEDIGEMSKGQRFPSNGIDWAFAMFDRVAAPMRRFYNAEEQVAKLAKFMYNQKELGMATREAATDAMKWTFNYGEITRATATMRNYAAPFFTWQSKILPLLAETAVKRPWKLGKWWLYYEGLQRMGINSVGLTGEEWDKIHKVLPEYIQDGQFLLMPWRDANKNLQILNLTYMIPGFGDITEMMAHPSDMMFGHPLMSVAAALRNNRSFSGVPITYDWEEPGVQFMKMSKYLWQALAPVPSFPAIPGSFDWDLMWKHYENHPEAPTWKQIAAAQVGFKIKGVDEVTRKRAHGAVTKIKTAELSTEMRRALRRAHPEDRKKIVERYQKLKQRLRKAREV